MDYFVEIFGMTIQEFLFSIFLPFIFFFLLLYALLRKSKILGEGSQTNRINSLIALTLSALSIFSLYSLGLSALLPIMGAITAVVAFVATFLLGTVTYSVKKQSSYLSQEAFKTKDEKMFDSITKNCEKNWKKFKGGDQKALREMDSEVKNFIGLAEKLGKDPYQYEWFKEYAELAKAREK